MNRTSYAALALGLVLCLVCSVPARGWDIYLEGYHGPYRGRIVDAETKEPIRGAVVVAVWRRDKVQPLHSTSVFYGAREVLTTEDGTFVVDGKELEQGAPARTLKPYFEVFSPGFARYRSRIFLARGFEEGLVFDKAGTTIGLPRLRTREERREVMMGALPPLVPDEAIPNLIRLINVEAAAIQVPAIRMPRER